MTGWNVVVVACFVLVLLPLAVTGQVPDYNRPYSPIFTDKPAYSWTDKIKITILAPSWNSDRHLIDVIGTYPEHPVKISTRGFSLDQYKLTETGVNNGIFTGEVILTGFLHDVDGDGKPDTNPRTTGSGPTNGFLETDHDSALTISFEFAKGVVVTKSVPISWNMGTIEFLTAIGDPDRRVYFRVVDPDMNLNPERIDQLQIHVYSDSDMAGLTVSAAETGSNSGIFEAGILLAHDGESSASRLYAVPGDIVYAIYEDRTLPEPYDTSDELDIITQTRLVSDVAPAKRLQIRDVSFLDGLGNIVNEPTPDRQFGVTAGIANNQQLEQGFTYLMQIKDSDGTVVKISWISAVLQPGGTAGVSLSWTPETSGDYTIESFTWESIDSMNPVSEPHIMHVSVR